MKTYKWGIIGTGSIAKHFVNSMSHVKDAEVYAVFSRNQNTADDFKNQFNLEKAYADIDLFLKDENIDFVYVATPHNTHYYFVEKTLNAKKPTLCEKPMCISKEEAEKLFSLSKEKQTFLMEAMWSSCLPTTLKLKEVLASGKIGKIRKVYGDFSYYSTVPNEHRVKNLNLAGGALYDLGVYSFHFLLNVLGVEGEIVGGDFIKGESGADYSATALVKYDGAIGICDSAINCQGHNLGIIAGEKGKIVFPSFWKGNKFTIICGEEKEEVEVEQDEYGFVYEIQETIECVKQGKLESDKCLIENTLKAHEWTDILLKKWGYK